MLIFGHRGAKGYCPENTLTSFQKAIDLGADAIELDVRFLRSREIIVMHDDTVDRTTNGTGLVEDYSLEEIRKLDAGQGEQVPTLEEVLDMAGNQIIINIEIKSLHMAKSMAGLLEKRAQSNVKIDLTKIFISSFHHNELKDFSRVVPAVRTGYLITDIPRDGSASAQRLNCYSINPSVESVTPEFVDNAHKNNLKVFVFTINTQKETQYVKSLGVDGIFTDFPDKIRDYLNT